MGLTAEEKAAVQAMRGSRSELRKQLYRRTAYDQFVPRMSTGKPRLTWDQMIERLTADSAGAHEPAPMLPRECLRLMAEDMLGWTREQAMKVGDEEIELRLAWLEGKALAAKVAAETA